MEAQHFFIFNPAAGARNAKERLQEQLKALDAVPYTLLITSGPGDATRLAQEICQSEEGPLRFYACGGDGTLGEVATGIQGFPKAAVGVWPCGSGNDYVKIYGGENRFLNISHQLSAPTVLVDLIRVGERAAINVVNLGLEAQAAATMLRFRHSSILGGKRAYLMGVADAFTSHLKTECLIKVDGEPLFEGELMTASFASGKYVGGAFLCAPKAVNDDGLMEVCAILPFPRLKLLKLLGIYKKGGHLDHPAFEGKVHYQRAGRVEISCTRDSALCLDGEIIRGRSFTLETLPKAVRFILPPGLDSQ